MSSKLESDVCCRLQVTRSGESYGGNRKPGKVSFYVLLAVFLCIMVYYVNFIQDHNVTTNINFIVCVQVYFIVEDTWLQSMKIVVVFSAQAVTDVSDSVLHDVRSRCSQ